MGRAQGDVLQVFEPAPGRAVSGTEFLARYTRVADHRFKLAELNAGNWDGIAVGVAISIAALAIVLGLTTAHPQITRQQAIQVALRYGSEQSYPRVQAKYMRYSDLADGTSGGFMVGAASRNDFIWVVAVSGYYGISPLGGTTWGIAVIKDEARSVTSPVFESGIKGSWPPFFDNLPDLTPVTPSAAS
jgi:hypothetical protein